MSTSITRVASATPLNLNDSSQFDVCVWVLAEAIYQDEHPNTGRLIHASHLIRGSYVRRALKAAATFQEMLRNMDARAFTQAAADMASHRAWVVEQSTMRCFHVTKG